MKVRPFTVLLLLTTFTISCKEVGNLHLFSIEQDVELGKQLRTEVLSNPQQYPVLDRNQHPQAYVYLENVVADIMKSGGI